MTFSFLFIGIAIVVEAGLSFLGLGVPPPQPSWGNMIAIGQSYLASNPDLVLVPAAFLFFTVMCLNLLGDALRCKVVDAVTISDPEADAPAQSFERGLAVDTPSTNGSDPAPYRCSRSVTSRSSSTSGAAAFTP